MPEAGIYNLAGEHVGSMELPESIFGIRPHTAVMHQALLRQLANARQGTSSTLTRGEVRGGGRKPWRQKGTGRARHGSIREPEFRGGGVAHGPHPRSYEQDMPRKMRRLAIRSAFSVAAGEGRIRLIENVDLEVPRTRAVAELFGALNLTGKVLVVLPSHNHNFEKSLWNLAGTRILLAGNANVRDLISHPNVLMTVETVRHLEEVFAS